jgi:hypothetical protein
MLTRDYSARLDRFNGADFIVGMHDTHEDRAGRDRSAEIVGVNSCCAIDGQIGYTPTQALEKPTRLDNGWMLDPGGDDMITLVPKCKEDALNSKVIRLAAAARENNLIALATKQRRHLATRCL